jgi:hypothetical protein
LVSLKKLGSAAAYLELAVTLIPIAALPLYSLTLLVGLVLSFSFSFSFSFLSIAENAAASSALFC